MSVYRLAVAAILLVIRPELALAGTAPEEQAPAGIEARSALRRQGFPWYDADRDEVKSLLQERSPWSRRLEHWLETSAGWLRRHFGQSGGWSNGHAGSPIPTLLFAIAAAAILVLGWRLWKLHEGGAEPARGTASIGDAARMAGLSPGVGLEGMDPWLEANRRRLSGDRQGAVTWLFLGHVLALDRAGLIRIRPGKTGRHYAAMLEDPALRADLQATLTVFEQVYYGRKDPDPRVVEDLWEQAGAFRRRLADLGKRPGE